MPSEQVPNKQRPVSRPEVVPSAGDSVRYDFLVPISVQVSNYHQKASGGQSSSSPSKSQGVNVKQQPNLVTSQETNINQTPAPTNDTNSLKSLSSQPTVECVSWALIKRLSPNDIEGDNGLGKSSHRVEWRRSLVIDELGGLRLADAIGQIETSLAGLKQCVLITDGPAHLRQYLHPIGRRSGVKLGALFDRYLDLFKEFDAFAAASASVCDSALPKQSQANQHEPMQQQQQQQHALPNGSSNWRKRLEEMLKFLSLDFDLRPESDTPVRELASSSPDRHQASSRCKRADCCIAATRRSLSSSSSSDHQLAGKLGLGNGGGSVIGAVASTPTPCATGHLVDTPAPTNVTGDATVIASGGGGVATSPRLAAGHCSRCSALNLNERLLQASCLIIGRMLDEGHQFDRFERIKRRVEIGLSAGNATDADQCVVRARGLPWQASEQDIADFFVGLNIAKGGVALCLSRQGRRNGEALIQFESREQRNLALSRHRHFMGARYIEVYRAGSEDFVGVASANSANNNVQAFLSKGAQVIIRMRGLPFTCTAKQVVDFFAANNHTNYTRNGFIKDKDLLNHHHQLASSHQTQINHQQQLSSSQKLPPIVHLKACKVLAGEEGVLFVKNTGDKPTGDAFVLFSTEDQAQRALDKHHQTIGSRYVELFRSSISEVQQVLSINHAQPTTTTTVASSTTDNHVNVPIGTTTNNQATTMSGKTNFNHYHHNQAAAKTMQPAASKSNRSQHSTTNSGDGAVSKQKAPDTATATTKSAAVTYAQVATWQASKQVPSSNLAPSDPDSKSSNNNEPSCKFQNNKKLANQQQAPTTTGFNEPTPAEAAQLPTSSWRPGGAKFQGQDDAKTSSDTSSAFDANSLTGSCSSYPPTTGQHHDDMNTAGGDDGTTTSVLPIDADCGLNQQAKSAAAPVASGSEDDSQSLSSCFSPGSSSTLSAPSSRSSLPTAGTGNSRVSSSAASSPVNYYHNTHAQATEPQTGTGGTKFAQNGVPNRQQQRRHQLAAARSMSQHHHHHNHHLHHQHQQQQHHNNYMNYMANYHHHHQHAAMGAPCCGQYAADCYATMMPTTGATSTAQQPAQQPAATTTPITSHNPHHPHHHHPVMVSSSAQAQHHHHHQHMLNYDQHYAAASLHHHHHHHHHHQQMLAAAAAAAAARNYGHLHAATNQHHHHHNHSSNADTNGHLHHQAAPFPVGPLDPSVASRRDLLQLRGLPFEARVEDVLAFLGRQSEHIAYQGIHMVFTGQGLPTGEAIIQMNSSQAAIQTAQQFHKQVMRCGKKQRYIEVHASSIDELRPFVGLGLAAAFMSAVAASNHAAYGSHPVSPTSASGAGSPQELVKAALVQYYDQVPAAGAPTELGAAGAHSSKQQHPAQTAPTQALDGTGAATTSGVQVKTSSDQQASCVEGGEQPVEQQQDAKQASKKQSDSVEPNAKVTQPDVDDQGQGDLPGGDGKIAADADATGAAAAPPPQMPTLDDKQQQQAPDSSFNSAAAAAAAAYYPILYYYPPPPPPHQHHYHQMLATPYH